jgi:hypothetical protein
MGINAGPLYSAQIVTVNHACLLPEAKKFIFQYVCRHLGTDTASLLGDLSDS